MLSEHSHHSPHKDVRQLKTRAATLFLHRAGSLPEALPFTWRLLREWLGMYFLVLLKTEQHLMDNSTCPRARKTANTPPSCSVLSLHHFSWVPLVELQDTSEKLQLPLRKSLLRCWKTSWQRAIGQQILMLNMHDSSVNSGQNWVINWE